MENEVQLSHHIYHHSQYGRSRSHNARNVNVSSIKRFSWSAVNDLPSSTKDPSFLSHYLERLVYPMGKLMILLRRYATVEWVFASQETLTKLTRSTRDDVEFVDPVYHDNYTDGPCGRTIDIFRRVPVANHGSVNITVRAHLHTLYDTVMVYTRDWRVHLLEDNNTNSSVTSAVARAWVLRLSAKPSTMCCRCWCSKTECGQNDLFSALQWCDSQL